MVDIQSATAKIRRGKEEEEEEEEETTGQKYNASAVFHRATIKSRYSSHTICNTLR